jgi:predicted ATPase
VDDLWGQFWLAGAAAGLNFCNKKALSKRERLAGLIYASAHMKRFCMEFGIKLPVEASNLYDRDHSLALDSGTGTVDKKIPGESQLLEPDKFTDLLLSEGAKGLVGRSAEIDEVTRMLDEHRLVTLNGPGGIGKTRLALAVAEQASHKFQLQFFFIPLLPVRSPSGIVPAIASALGIKFLEGRTPLTQLLDHLRSQKMLLVLDNIEQLLFANKAAGTIDVIEAILKTSRETRLLVTSRELLRISDERVFTVKGLSVSDHRVDENLSDDCAVELFCLRAKDVLPSFEERTADNLFLIQQFCDKVEGMPLAIELAAAQMRLLSLEDILNQIEADLDVLDSGLRGEKARHASIKLVFETSWRSLTIDEQKIFARLAVFQGAFTLESAQKVAQANLTVLSMLLDKSLINKDASGRFVLHALIKMFAARKLVETPGELSLTQQNHFYYYRDLLFGAVNNWRESTDTSLIDPLKPEVDNLRAAWMWVVDQLDWMQTAEYSEYMWHLYKVLGRLPEAIEMLEETLQVGRSVEPPAAPVYLARWERNIGQAHLWLSQLSEGDKHFQLSLSHMEWSLPESLLGLVRGLAVQFICQLAHRILPGFFIGRKSDRQVVIYEAYVAYEHITMRAGIESDTFMSAYCGLRSLNLAESAMLKAEMARAYSTAGYMIGLIPLRGVAQWYLKQSQCLLQQEYTVESGMWISLLSGYYHFGTGELSTAEEEFQRTARLAGELGKHWEKENAWTQIFIIALLKGEWNRCLEYAELIEISARKRGDAGYLAAVIYWEATVKLYRGEMEGVVQLLEESASAPDEVMMVFDWLVLRSSLATAYIRLGDFGSAAQEGLKLERLLEGISRPSGPSFIFGYAGTANVFLDLTENEPDEIMRNKFLKRSHQAVKRLDFFARLFPVAEALARLYRGKFEWISGKQRTALQSWIESLNIASEMDIPYQQGLAHYEIGSHLGEGELAPDGRGAPAHLQRAYQIFAALDSVYDFNLTIIELEKLGVE